MRAEHASITRERTAVKHLPPHPALRGPSSLRLRAAFGGCGSDTRLRAQPKGKAGVYSTTSHPGKYPFQNFPPALALLGHGFRAVLAQAHAVAIAAGRKGKCVLPRVIVHGERCRPQAERVAQLCPGEHLPAERHLRHIARCVRYAPAEPIGGGVWYPSASSPSAAGRCTPARHCT